MDIVEQMEREAQRIRHLTMALKATELAVAVRDYALAHATPDNEGTVRILVQRVDAACNELASIVEQEEGAAR